MSIEEQIAREAAVASLARQNPRFALYREQDPTFRQSDVDFWTTEFIAAIKRAVAIEREIVAQAIEAEPELPGDMPEQMWKTVQNDKNAAIELLRITVRLTKQGIRDRLGNPMQKELK